MTDEALDGRGWTKLDSIADSAEHVQRLTRELGAERRHLAAMLREGLGAGFSPAEVARAAGLSRSGLYRALAVAEGRAKKITKDAQRHEPESVDVLALTVQPVPID